MRTRAVAVSLCLLAGTSIADEVQFTQAEVRAILSHGPWPTPIASDPEPGRIEGLKAARASRFNLAGRFRRWS